MKPLLLLIFCLPWALLAKEYQVRIASGDSLLENAVISAKAPADLPETGHLKGDGENIPFQKNSAGEIVFIVPSLKPGSARTFDVVASSTSQEIEAKLSDGHITLSTEGKPILVYQGKETDLPRPDIKPVYKRGGYIHPVYSPSGKLVTDDFPRNHLHHHGIWAPWTKTVFEGRDVDFWNMGDGKGKVEFVSFEKDWSGPVHAGFSAKQRFVDLTTGASKPALDETWTVTAYRVPGANYFLFDLVSTQQCSSASSLILPKYFYGGLGFRGNWDWNGVTNCSFLTANGETNRVKGNETRANWCHIGGLVDGQLTGIGIFCHPDNFRAPQPMRLHPSEPFFCYAPSQMGDWSIEPGKAYISRYRFVVMDGKPDAKGLETLWQNYAHPPHVTIVEK